MTARRQGLVACSWAGTAAESLEIRVLLAAQTIGEIHATPAYNVTPLVSSASPIGYTPDQVRHAYGFDGIRFAGGTVPGDGRGTTIAIIDAFDDPQLDHDLRVFDSTFGLPAPALTRVNQFGGTVLPESNVDWSLETALDVEWAHAMAPAASILLVEAQSTSLDDLITGAEYARRQPGVVAVSMSWGAPEFSSEAFYDSRLTTPPGHSGVIFTAATGDTGAPAQYPAYSPGVVAIGGTNLVLSGSSYVSETGWSKSGGGTSQFEPRPDYQAGFAPPNSRNAPDVAYGADPSHGFAVYDSATATGTAQAWLRVGGTSAGTPQWAALAAIVDQGRAMSGQGPLDNLNALLYRLPAADFHDVVTGNNGYVASAGFDLVTGRGSPIVSQIVPDLLGSTGQASAVPRVPGEMFRLYNPNAGLHVFTASQAERDFLVQLGYADETSVATSFLTLPAGDQGSFPLFRLYNPNGGQHYLTTSVGERDSLVQAGWNFERIEGNIRSSPVASFVEVFRLYNQANGEHLYTTSAAERDFLTSLSSDWVETAPLGFAQPLPGSSSSTASTSTASAGMSTTNLSGAAVLALPAASWAPSNPGAPSNHPALSAAQTSTGSPVGLATSPNDVTPRPESERIQTFTPTRSVSEVFERQDENDTLGRRGPVVQRELASPKVDLTQLAEAFARWPEFN